MVNPMILQFKISANTATTIELPLHNFSSNTVYSVDWGDSTSIDICANTHIYASVPSVTIYTVELDVSSGAIGHFGSTDSLGKILGYGGGWRGMANIYSVIDWGDLGGLTSLYAAFIKAINLTSLPANIPETVTNLTGMFMVNGTFNQDISSWNTSNVTRMDSMFMKTAVFNQDISEWDVSNVTSMGYMFWEALSFNQPIGKWNVSNVTNMYRMFMKAYRFNQDLNQWDVSNVTNFQNIFRLATRFNQDLSQWNVSSTNQTLSDFFLSAGIDSANYTKLLIGWAALNETIRGSSFIFRAPTVRYYDVATDAFNYLDVNLNWIIQPTTATLSISTPDLIMQYNEPTNREYKFGQSIQNYTPVVFGTYDTIIFGISPTLPDGLSIDTTTGSISGIPFEFSSIANYTVTATSYDSSSEVLNTLTKDLSFSVINSDFYYDVSAINVLFKNSAINPTITPTINGGITLNSFSVSPTFISDISINSTNGTIFGTPLSLFGSTLYTVSATKTNNSVTTTSIRFSSVDVSYADISFVFLNNIDINNIIPTISSGTLTFSSTDGSSLPNDLTLNPATGYISGAPTVSILDSSFNITATTSSGYTKELNIDYTVADVSYAPIDLSHVFLKDVGINVIQSNELYSNDFTYSLTSGSAALPSNIAFDASSGDISGTPIATVLDSSFSITATLDGTTYSKDFSFNYTVADVSYAPIDLSHVFLKDVAINTVEPNEVNSTFIYTLTSGSNALPIDISLGETTGDISGTPRAVILDSSFSITATVPNTTYSKDISFNYTVADINYTDFSYVFLKDVTINDIFANELYSEFTYAQNGGPALPTNLTFDTSGVISGLPNATILDSSFNIRATIANGGLYSKDISLNFTVADISYDLIDLSHVFLKDVAINTVEPNEVNSTFIYTLTSGSNALPIDISFGETTGDISGTPRAVILDSSFSITATVPNTTYSKDFSFNYTVADVSYAPIDLSHVFLKDVGINVIQPNELYSNDFTYSLTSGSAALPSNIALDASSGDISGTPIATVLDSSFSITATLDGTTYSKDFSFNYTVADVSYAPIDLSHVFLKDVGINVIQPNELYSNDFTYSLTSGSAALPSNIALDAFNGDISGTPISTVLDSSFSITATLDGTTYSKDFSFNYTVADINYTDFSYVFLKDVTINDISANELYSKFTYAQNGGPALPTNLTFDTSGVISGLPTETILDSSFNIRATIANGGLYSKDISLNLTVADISYDLIDLSHVFLKDVAINTVEPNEVNSTFIYTLTSGSNALPIDISFGETTGDISGTPRAVILDSSFSITATVPNTTYSKDFSFNYTVADVSYAPIDLSHVFLKDVTINIIEPNELYSNDFTYSLTSGSAALPSNIALDASSGDISGTPIATVLDSSFSITATLDGTTYSKDFSFNYTVADVSYAPIDLSHVFLKDVGINVIQPNELYSNDFTYSLTSGSAALPSNIALDAFNGDISGTPISTVLDSSFSITATLDGTTYSKDFSFNYTVADVSYAPIDLSHVFLKDVGINVIQPNELYSNDFTYSLTSGSAALPSNIALDTSTGDISGIPISTVLDSSFSITATLDGTTYSKDISFNYTVADVNYTDFSYVFLKDVAINDISANELYSKFTYAQNGGPALPTNLTFDTSGVISGLPNATILDSSFNIRATMANGGLYSKDISLNFTVADISYDLIDLSHVFLKDVSINTVEPNEVNSTFIYTLTSGSNALPIAISLGETTGDISGTPRAVILDSSFSITATVPNTTYSKDFSFNYTVADINYTDFSYVFLKDVTINDIIPGEIYSEFTYAQNGGPALPTNLTFDTSGVISGLPTETILDSSFNIRATMANGGLYSKDFSFNYTVADINYTDFSYVFLKDVAINDISANELYSKFTYAQNGGPDLPTGLSFVETTIYTVTRKIFTVISGGDGHSIAVTDEGKVYAWGNNDFGQLGLGDYYNNRKNPTLIDYSNNDFNFLDETIISVSAGYGHSLALTDEGKVYAWGYNDYGQLGLGLGYTSFREVNPTLIDYSNNDFNFLDETIIGIAAGSFYSLALTDEGKVYAWGYNNRGQLGLGNSGFDTQREIPTLIDYSNNDFNFLDETIISIAAGEYHSLAVTDQGKVYAWGYNFQGQLGIGVSGSGIGVSGSNAYRLNPTLIDYSNNDFNFLDETIISVSAGYYHSHALTDEGKVYAWGYNKEGQLGLGDSGINASRKNPTLIDYSNNDFNFLDETIISISTGNGHSLAVTDQGKVYAWGHNLNGQLGLGYTSNQEVNPTLIDYSNNDFNFLDETIISIATGYYHSFAVTDQGKVYAWGHNDEGHLGLGDSGINATRKNPTLINLNTIDVLNTAVTITGTPTETILDSSFNIRATMANGGLYSKDISLNLTVADISYDLIDLSHVFLKDVAINTVEPNEVNSTFIYTLTSGSNALPIDISFGETTGDISGTPHAVILDSSFSITATVPNTTYSKDFSFNYTVADASYTLVDISQVFLKDVPINTIIPGEIYGDFSYNIVDDGTELPTRLFFNQDTGSIYGTPLESVNDKQFKVLVKLTGTTYSKPYTFNYTVADINYTDLSYVFMKDVSINDISANELYSKFTYAQNGGPALPTNLTFDTSGVISGLPNATILDSSFNIRATLANGGLYSKDISFNLTVADISYDLVDLSQVFLKDVAINTIEPNEVNSNFVYTLTSGSNALPLDVSFGETTGNISGTPHAVILDSSFSITATVPNTTYSKDISFNYTVADVSYAPVDLSHVFLKDVSINVIQPNEIYGNFTYADAGGITALPNNLNLSETTGDISGTPIATTLDSIVTIIATLDGTTYSKDISFNYTVADISYGLVDMSYVFMKDVTINDIIPGEIYSEFTYAQNGGPAIPTNLTFDTSGVIAGLPNATILDSSFNIRATMANGGLYSKDISFNFTVADISYDLVDLSHVFLKDVSINVIEPNEVNSTFIYTLTSGSNALPVDVLFGETSGDISGTPRAAILDSSFSITATVPNTTYSKDFSFNYTVADISYGLVDLSYVFMKDVTINDIIPGEIYSKFTYAQNGGPAIPTNLTFDTSGVIAGLPNATILDSSFNIRATMANGGLYSKDISFNLTVADISYDLVDLSHVFLKDVSINVIEPNEVNSTFIYTLTSGSNALPVDVLFGETSGDISGTPRAAILDSSFSITATVPNTTYSKDFSFNYTVADISYANFSYVFMKDVTINDISANELYSEFTYAQNGGPAIPTNLTFDTSGVIAGLPNATILDSSFNIRATMANGGLYSKDISFNLTVADISYDLIDISQVFLKDVAINTIEPNEVNSNFIYTLTSGSTALPSNIALNVASGNLSGTPTTAAILDSSFSITATVPNTTYSKDISFNYTISDVSYTQLSYIVVKDVSINNIFANERFCDFSFSTTEIPLPAGLTLNTETGDISGTPLSTTSNRISKVRASQINGLYSKDIYFSITVADVFYKDPSYGFIKDLQIIPIYPIVVNGPFTYSLSSESTIPTDLSFNQITGKLFGKPDTVVLDSSFIILATIEGYTKELLLNFTVDDTSYSDITYQLLNGVSINTIQPFSSSNIFTYKIKSGTTLLDDLTIDSSNGYVDGTPSISTLNKNIAVTATTYSGYSKDISFNCTVADVTYSDISYVFFKDVDINTLEPNELHNTFTYSVSGSSPDIIFDLSLNPSNGNITGIPEQTGLDSSFIITALMNGGVYQKDISLNFTVADVSYSDISYVFLKDIGIQDIIPNKINDPFTYSITSGSTFPNIFNLNATNGVISGTPTSVTNNTSLNVSVTTPSGYTKDVSFGIIVSDVSYADISYVFLKDVTIDTIEPNELYADFSYAVSSGHTLLNNLTINNTNGYIDGIPNNPILDNSLNITVTVTNGSYPYTKDIPLKNLTVADISYNLVDLSHVFLKDVSINVIEPNELYSSFIYTLTSGSNALPIDVSIGETSGDISGTPRAAILDSSFSITATVPNTTYSKDFSFNYTVADVNYTDFSYVFLKDVTINDISANELYSEFTYAQNGGPDLPTGLTFVETTIYTVISCGFDHSLAVTDEGKVYAWGYNYYGQLGLGTSGNGTNESSPVLIPTTALSNVSGIAAGRFHSLAFTTNGEVYAWGRNNSGQLGLGTSGDENNESSPVLIPTTALSNVSGIAAGFDHSLALTTNGEVYAWGNNNNGQLGLGYFGSNENNESSPVLIPTTDLSNVSGIAAGHSHSLAFTTNGEVYAWGNNYFGQLGLGTSGDENNESSPVLIPTTALSNVSGIAAGNLHSLAFTTNGEVYAWGYNYYGQLGLGTSGNAYNESSPTLITALSNITVSGIAAGAYHSLAFTTNGEVYAWGYNNEGQLGLGTSGDENNESSPVLIPTTDLSNVSGIAAGSIMSLAVTDEGKVYAWGYNNNGQLGLGDDSIIQQKSPVIISDPFGLYRITGTPTETILDSSFNIRATMANGGLYSKDISLNLTVADINYNEYSYLYLKDVEIRQVIPIETYNTFSYQVNPALGTLIADLAFDENTGVLDGTPSIRITDNSLNIIATMDGSTYKKDISFNITVTDITYPTDTSYVFLQNKEPLTSIITPFETNITPTYYDSQYFNDLSFNPPLPRLLDISLLDGVISGIPRIATPETLFNLTATITSGYSKDISFNVMIEGFNYDLTGAINGYILPYGADAFIRPPENIGGYSDFSITPTLPIGLHLDIGSGSIKGVPLEITDPITYSITATRNPSITNTIILQICNICPDLPVIQPREISVHNTNASRYSTLARTRTSRFGQMRFISNENQPIQAPFRNKF